MKVSTSEKQIFTCEEKRERRKEKTDGSKVPNAERKFGRSHMTFSSMVNRQTRLRSEWAGQTELTLHV